MLKRVFATDLIEEELWILLSIVIIDKGCRRLLKAGPSRTMLVRDLLWYPQSSKLTMETQSQGLHLIVAPSSTCHGPQPLPSLEVRTESTRKVAALDRAEEKPCTFVKFPATLCRWGLRGDTKAGRHGAVFQREWMPLDQRPCCASCA